MLFTEHHIELLLNDEKTVTRRDWDSKQVVEGNSYRATTDLFTPRDEAPAYITVTDVYTEPLEHLTEQQARMEGDYTVDEFKSLWTEMHGDWNGSQEVWVVEFEAHEEDPR